MRLVGTLLIVLGVTIIWLIGIQGYDPGQAISQVRSDLKL